MKKSDIHKIIKEEIQNHMIKEGIVNWMLNKVEQFGTNMLKSKTEYSLARVTQDPEFRKLSKKFGMKEDEFVRKAEGLIKQDPKKFASILTYDVRNDSQAKKWFGLK
jgi:hypothetical protein